MPTPLTGSVQFLANNRPIQNVAERIGSAEEATRRNNDAVAQNLRVAMPAQVVSFNAAKQTIVAQPLVREQLIDRTTGERYWQALPQLLDVPVHFPQGGAFALTLPLQAGDEVLIICADNCIDSWFTSGGIQNWNDRRRHDLSDGFAIPGINSVPNVIPDISSTAAELRTKDGAVKVSVAEETLTLSNGDASLEVTDAGFSLSIGNATISMTNNLFSLTVGDSSLVLTNTTASLDGQGADNVFLNGTRYTHHSHYGVTPGSSFTYEVTP